MSTQTPTLAEVFDAAMKDRLRESFGGWLPARVESYDDDTNRAIVQVLVLDDYENEEGERVTEAFPSLTDVPVAFMSLGGRFCIRSTVSVGDEGMVFFPSRDTGKWLQTGGIVDPEDDSAHDFNNAVFFPYRLSAGGSNADPMIEITATTVDIGGTNNLVTRSEFLSHTHLTAPTGPTTYPTVLAGPGGSTVTFPGTQKLRGG